MSLLLDCSEEETSGSSEENLPVWERDPDLPKSKYTAEEFIDYTIHNLRPIRPHCSHEDLIRLHQIVGFDHGWRVECTGRALVNRSKAEARIVLNNREGDKVDIIMVKSTCFYKSLIHIKSMLCRFPDNYFRWKFSATGEIRMSSEDESDIYWVYHNVCIRMRFYRSEHGVDLDSFLAFAHAVFQRIRVGATGSYNELMTCQRMMYHGTVSKGHTFEIHLPVVHDGFIYGVDIEKKDQVTWTGCQETEHHGRTYTFIAEEIGEVNIYLCFAHDKTLQFTSLRATVTVTE